MIIIIADVPCDRVLMLHESGVCPFWLCVAVIPSAWLLVAPLLTFAADVNTTFTATPKRASTTHFPAKPPTETSNY